MGKGIVLKKVLILFVILLIVFIPVFFIINNYYAKNQRESIRYCSSDEDCTMQNFNLYPCGSWAGCFNKNEKPMDDIVFSTQTCEYPTESCDCDQGRCLDCFGEWCR